MKVKKRKKTSRLRGSTRAWRGNRKRGRGSGHKGGKGMAGTGKKAGQKRTWVAVQKEPYFGRRGTTSKPTAKKKAKALNLSDVMRNIDNYKKNNEIVLEGYKILGEGEVKEKLIVKCDSASRSAVEKVEKAGGKIITKEVNKSEDKKEVKKIS
jgi:large subunit ribosomal protein L15